MGLLPHDHILKLHAAVISAQLIGSRSALLTGLDGHFVAGLPEAQTRADQMLQDLDAMNRTGELADGSMPLATWLTNALGRTHGKREEAIFAEALERVRPGSSARSATAASSRTTGARVEPAPGAAPVVHHHHGDVHMGSTFTTNITGSTIGAFAQGDGATATGTVHVHHAEVSQAQHEEHVKRAKKALVDDEGKLGELVHEALGQFLKLARTIQVEQQSLAETQAKMKATLDAVWVAQVAKGMKPEGLPKTLEVVKALMANPVMGEVTKKLVCG